MSLCTKMYFTVKVHFSLYTQKFYIRAVIGQDVYNSNHNYPTERAALNAFATNNVMWVKECKEVA